MLWFRTRLPSHKGLVPSSFGPIPPLLSKLVGLALVRLPSLTWSKLGIQNRQILFSLKHFSWATKIGNAILTLASIYCFLITCLRRFNIFISAAHACKCFFSSPSPHVYISPSRSSDPHKDAPISSESSSISEIVCKKCNESEKHRLSE